MDLKFRTPWPPSVNNYWRMAKGRIYIAQHGAQYRLTVRDIVHGLCLDRQMTGRLSLAAELHAPDNRRRDIDNVLKAMLDAIQKSDLIDDDNQFDELIVHRGTVAPGEGYVDLTIVELGPGRTRAEATAKITGRELAI